MKHARLGIELTHLRYFVTVAEELHFGRAAQKLAISQPPLTQQIQRLEQRIGFPLFARSTRQTELTEAGSALLPLARAVLENADRAIEAAQRAGHGESGELTVATPPSVMLGDLPRVIRWFRRSTPGVELRLREMATSAVEAALETGTADLGFLRSPALPAGLRELSRFQEDVAAILPLRHRLAGVKRLRLAHLAKEPFVFFPRRLGAAFHEELLGYCRDAGFEPRIVEEATQWSSVVALVHAGLGVTLGPAPVARLAGGRCTARRLAGLSTTVILAGGPRRLTAQAERFAAACASRLKTGRS